MGTCQSTKINPEVKVLFIGSSNSGKSSLINAIFFDIFEPLKPTEQITQIDAIIDDTRVVIWDTPGDMDYIDLLTNDITHIVLCIGIEEHYKQGIVERCKSAMRLMYSHLKPHLIIVITKSDLLNSSSTMNFRNQMMFTSYSYIETSAKENLNIHFFFQKHVLKTMPKRTW